MRSRLSRIAVALLTMLLSPLLLSPLTSPPKAAPSVVAPAAAPLGTLTVHVSPHGNDKSSGLSARAAVRTIDRAEVVAVNNRGKERDVDVRIAAGTYRGQSADWTTASPGHRVRFIPAAWNGRGAPAEKIRPVFDGRGKNDYWLNIEPSKRSSGTRFEVHGMTVRNYTNGLRISGGYRYKGSPTAYAHGIGAHLPGVRVQNNTFTRIGDAFTGGAGTGWAALSLQNVSGARVTGNTMSDVRNRDRAEYSLVHGVYAVYSNVEVRSNRFATISGDAVRLRSSTSGKIHANTFTRTGRYGAVSDWYCNRACAREHGQMIERPSTKVSVTGNAVGRSFSGGPLAQFKRTV
jgi:hypothetical protein